MNIQPNLLEDYVTDSLITQRNKTKTYGFVQLYLYL